MGLHGANKPIRVIDNNKKIALRDGHGSDTNCALIIESGDLTFSDDGKNLIGPGTATIRMGWSDNPGSAGVAVQRITFGDKVWTQSCRSGSQTHTVLVTSLTSTQNNNSNIKLRNKGDNVVQMEDLPDNVSDWDWQDIMCVASEGRFYDFNGNTCKYVIGNDVTTSSTRNGVVYKGPKLFNY